MAAGGVGYAAAKISGNQIKAHSIAGNRLKSNTITGSQVKESTLGTVPKAKKATSSTYATYAARANVVDGSEIVPFSFTVDADGTAQTVTVPGGELTGSCASSAVSLTMDSAGTSGESAVAQGNDGSAAGFEASTSDLSDTFGLSPDGATTGAGTAVITRSSDEATTVVFSYLTNSDGSCTYSGTATGTAS